MGMWRYTEGNCRIPREIGVDVGTMLDVFGPDMSREEAENSVNETHEVPILSEAGDSILLNGPIQGVYEDLRQSAELMSQWMNQELHLLYIRLEG